MNKIKNVIYVGILALAFVACSKNENTTFSGEFLQIGATSAQVFSYEKLNDGIGVESGFSVNLAGPQKSSEISFDFEVDPSSTAIENLHYVIDSGSGTIPANSSKGTIPITILDDNIEPGEQLSVIVNLTGSSVAINQNYSSGTHLIQVSCDGDLRATYTFVSTDNFANTTTMGEGEITLFDPLSPGEYKFTDFTFGTWAVAYGIDPPTGTILFKENCGAVSIDGLDNYGAEWSLTDVSASNGPEFTFTWTNTYMGEYGVVTLTRTDGQNWPPLLVR